MRFKWKYLIMGLCLIIPIYFFISCCEECPQCPEVEEFTQPGKIYFSCDRDGDEEICAVGEDGKHHEILTNDKYDNRYPDVSPDGTELIFYRDIGGDYEIFKMDIDGSNIVQLTDNIGISDILARWSPDGLQIVYVQRPGYNSTLDDIWVMNADGSQKEPLQECNDADSQDSDPHWSPDGNTVVFISDRDRTNNEKDIYTFHIPSKQVNRLTTTTANHQDPIWSPDGSQILFASDRDGSDLEIYIINIDDEGTNRLTDNNYDDDNPYWSPDGSKIVFDYDSTTNKDLYIIYADGTGRKKLLDCDSSEAYPVWVR